MHLLLLIFHVFRFCLLSSSLGALKNYVCLNLNLNFEFQCAMAAI